MAFEIQKEPVVNPAPELVEMNARVVGVAVGVFTLEAGKKKPVGYSVPLTPKQQQSVLNFIKHKCHGGRLVLRATEPTGDEPRIIAP